MSITQPYKLFALSLVACSLLLAPFASEARTVIRSGDTVSIAQDQLIKGDFYTGANIVNISGEIEEDLLAAGAEVTVNGQVGEDAFIIGGNVDIHGVVGDDLRVIGGDVIIAEPVRGDVFVVAGTVKVLSTASITGDLTVVGGSAEVAGPVEGRILGYMESLRIDAQVDGNVEVTATTLVLGDKANVIGNVQYVSREQLTRSQSAVVEGEVVRNDPVVETSTTSVTALVLPVLVLLFSVALWYLLSRRMLQRVTNRALMPGIRPIILGLAVVLLTPFAISILLLSMLGSLVGFALFATYVLFLVLAIAAIPAVIGQLLMNVIQKGVQPINLLTLLLGSVVAFVCFFIPIVGPAVLFGFFLLAFGALVDLLVRSSR